MHTALIDREQLIELVDTIWSSMLGLPVVPGNGDGDIRDANDLCACVHISGAFNGSVWLLTSEAFARVAAAQMLQRPGPSIETRDAHDAAAELCNIIGGNIKGLLPRPSSLSLPVFMPASTLAVSRAQSVSLAQWRFKCAGETVEVQLVEQLSDEIPATPSDHHSSCGAGCAPPNNH